MFRLKTERRYTKITSAQNPLLKEVRKAVARGGRTGSGCVVAEGFHLLEEALRSDLTVKAVLTAASIRTVVESRIGSLRGHSLYEAPDKLFEQIASTESSQGVIALVEPPQWSLEQLFRGRSLVVALDGVQDPGNAGSIVRAAEAFGATGCIFLKGTASPYNPKTLRASAGSLFRLPVIAGMNGEVARAAIESRRLDLYAAMPSGGRPLPDADLTRKFAFAVGAEGRGVSAALSGGAIDLVIPTSGVESLNAAMAAGIVLYEARRQRMKA